MKTKRVRRAFTAALALSALSLVEIPMLNAKKADASIPSPDEFREIAERAYWQMDFPDQGDEERGQDPKTLVDAFEQVMLRAVDMRLKADVPVTGKRVTVMIEW